MNVNQLHEDLQAFHRDHLQLSNIVQEQAERIKVLEKARESTEKIITQNFLEAENELTSLRSMIIKQNDTIRGLKEENSALKIEVNTLKNNTTNISSTPTRETRIADPEFFSGNRKKSLQFLLQCQNVFNMQPISFQLDSAKVSFCISFLRGNAFEWISPYMQSNHKILSNFEQFQEAFLISFGDIDRKLELEKSLMELKQGNRSASILVSEFQRLAVEMNWPDEVLAAHFYRALREEQKDQVCKYDRPESIDEFYKMVIRLDNRLWERRNEKSRITPQKTVPPKATTNPNAMIIGNTRIKTPKTKKTNIDSVYSESESNSSTPSKKSLSYNERRHRRDNNLCAYCGDHEHSIEHCPLKPNRKPKNFQPRR